MPIQFGAKDCTPTVFPSLSRNLIRSDGVRTPRDGARRAPAALRESLGRPGMTGLDYASTMRVARTTVR